MKTKLSAIVLILTVLFAVSGISYGCYDPPPYVVITCPIDGAPFVEGNDITIDANASDTSPGYITRVEFYKGTTLLGTDTNAPYSFVWNDANDSPDGNLVLTARAYDNAEQSADSIPVQMLIPIIWYVDDDAPAGGNGRDWTTALKYLQDALTNPYKAPSDEIRVAGGTYKPDRDMDHPDGTGDPSATFQLVNGIPVKGGYAGLSNPTDPDERDIVNYETILSGDLMGDDGVPPDFANYVAFENSYHVVTGSGTDATAILDGFTIQGGDALDPRSAPPGAGAATGGGMYNDNGSPTVINCIFRYNLSWTCGGGVLNSESSPIFINCIFSENMADRYGGAIFNSNSSSTFINCVFVNNLGAEGGAIFNSSGTPINSPPKIINCTFTGNGFATITNGTYYPYNAPIMTNCILWDDGPWVDDLISAYGFYEIKGTPVTATYCDIKGGYQGVGNIDSDPEFLNPDFPEGQDGLFRTDDDGLQLQLLDVLGGYSPCIDVADDSCAPPTDILGHNRTDVPTIGFAVADMGAYEQAILPPMILDQLKISGGEDHTMLLQPDDYGVKGVWSCGSGPLGNPDYSYSSFIVQAKGKDNIGYLENIDFIDGGYEHALAVDEDDYVWAWGGNSYGQVGDGSTTTRETPVEVTDGEMGTTSGLLEDIVEVAAGRCGSYSLAFDSTGRAWAWGANGSGQLGNGKKSGTPPGYQGYEPEPVRVLGLENVTDIDGGITHSIALDSGNVWAWGLGSSGQLGQGSSDTTTHATPVKVKGEGGTGYLENIVDVAVTTEVSSYALDADGHVWAWGAGYYGQLGQGSSDKSNHYTPVKVKGKDGIGVLENIVAISAGMEHALALDSSGNLWAWGYNGSGQLGNGEFGMTETCYTPARVKKIDADSGFLTNIFYADAGYKHSLAIDKSGNFWAWGSNSGKLGLGPQNIADQPFAQIMMTKIPKNDECEDALPVVVGKEYRGATYLTSDGSVWFSFTPTTKAYYDISLCDSDFDTSLRVYEYCEDPDPAYSEDDCGVQSILTLKLIPGITYLIEVSGYSSYRGNYVLTVDFSDRPINDECEDALPVVINQTYTGSTDEALDETHWYSFTPETSGSVDISLCGSDFDTQLWVYQAPCPGTYLIWDEDSCPGSYASHISAFDVTAEQTYLIKVCGYSGDSGNYVLNITPH